MLPILFVFSFLFLAACSDPEKKLVDQVESISIAPSSLLVAGIGSRYQLSLSGKLTNGADTEPLSGVVWSSSNAGLATVDGAGLVTVFGKGTLTITAEYLNLKAVISVEIVDVALLDLFPISAKLTALNQVFSLNVVAKAPNGDVISNFNGAQWASTNSDIASVDIFGNITTHATGVASITASYENKTATSSIVVDESGDLIDGVAQYTDRLYDTSGFTGYEAKAIRLATIELLDENGGILISTATDETGAYNFGNAVPDVYSIRLLAQVTSAPAAGFTVTDMQGGIYSYIQLSSSNTLKYDFMFGSTSSASGVFNLLDVATFSAKYVTQVLGLAPSDLQIFWEKNYGLTNTYYCTGFDQASCFNGKGIYILSLVGSQRSVDSDEFDDDVIMHEFGHFLTTTYSVDDSEGGQHIITQNDSDLRLSWSEGWGLFFPTVVKDWLRSSRPSLMSFPSGAMYYIDTIGNKAGLTHNIAVGEPLDGGDGFYYASSEAAVGRILWNVLQDFGMPKIWDVMVNYLPVSGKPTSLPVFWDGLLASDLYLSNELPQLDLIFADRRVIYQEDLSEPDDTALSATYQVVDVIPSVASTLYDADTQSSDALVNDIDFISFDAVSGQSYTIFTTELYNGIDTLIQLYDPQGRLVSINDDAIINSHDKRDSNFGVNRVRNNTTAMASQIKLAAMLSGRYVVAVKYADKRSSSHGFGYDFVGHYGSYKLVISAQ